MPNNALLQSLEDHLAQLPVEDLPALLGDLERLKAQAWAKLACNHTKASHPSTPLENGHYLTVSEVVQRFNVTARWLYRHKKRLPHSQPSRKVLLFPEAAIRRWFEKRV